MKTHRSSTTKNHRILSTATTSLFPLILLAVFCVPGNISAECIDGDCTNGQGTYIWANGDKYVGQWKDGKQNGEGSFIWPEGDRFVGKWKNGRNTGQGKYLYSEGAEQNFDVLANTADEHFGCISGDCVNGSGVYIWLSGANYIGEFENGKKEGLGTYSFPNGQKIQGIWDNGRYVGEEDSMLSQLIARARE